MIVSSVGQSKAHFFSYEEWESSRATFSHDWLRNGLAIALGKVANVLKGAVDDPNSLAQLAILLEQWPEYRDEAFSITAAACDVLSPNRSVDVGLFAGLDSETKRFLGEVADTVWQRSRKPEEVVRQVNNAIQALDIQSERMALALDVPRGVNNDSQRLQELVSEMRLAVAHLSELMTQLGQCKNF